MLNLDLSLSYGRQLIKRTPNYGAENTSSVQAKADLKWFQRALGIPDTGNWDNQTKMAIQQFQANNPDVPETGRADRYTAAKLYDLVILKRRIWGGIGIASVIIIGGLMFINNDD